MRCQADGEHVGFAVALLSDGFSHAASSRDKAYQVWNDHESHYTELGNHSAEWNENYMTRAGSDNSKKGAYSFQYEKAMNCTARLVLCLR